MTRYRVIRVTRRGHLELRSSVCIAHDPVTAERWRRLQDAPERGQVGVIDLIVVHNIRELDEVPAEAAA